MTPFFSICIPQYNRTSFLKVAINSFKDQNFSNFELCISDGGSNDGRIDELEEFLDQSGLGYRLARSLRNLRYDENLRSAIGLSSGRYVLLMGNDDAFADASCLQDLHDTLVAHPATVVAITNYRELSTGRVYRRMAHTGPLGSGPKAASETFRHYSFLSGVVLDGPKSRAAATDRVDGSEMYQMYLGARHVAEGGTFLGIDRLLIDKDIQVPGETVDSYRTRQKGPRWSFVERPLPLGRIVATVAAGIEMGSPSTDNRSILAQLARQLYVFTYPFWVFEYRRVQSWAFAVGVYRALRPSVTCCTISLRTGDRLKMWILYLVQGLAAFVIPIAVFDLLRGRLYKLAKPHRKAGKPRSTETLHG